MQIMVFLDSQQPPFYRRNRGFILDANRGSLVEEYIAEGCGTFRAVFDSPTNPRAICIGASQLSLFNVEDRVVSSPTNLKKRCGESCRSIASFKDHGLIEATTLLGLRLKAERSIVPIVVYGRREELVVVIITVLDENVQQLQRMSIPLPKDLKLHGATFVNKCSHLLISLNELVMIWSAPVGSQDKFELQLVHAVDNPTSWKVCPHRQVYGLRTQSQDVSIGIDLNDPIPGMKSEFMCGVARLPLIFDNACDFVHQQIIQYISNNLNFFCSVTCYDSDIVRPDMVKKDNPIFCLLAQTDKYPKAFELAEVFMDYCIRRARLEKDPHFLLPIRQCLQELTNPSKPYSEITLKLYREIAYLPVRNIILACFFVLVNLSIAFILTFMRMYGLAITSKVECHPFELEALDNPAIAALVVYKWNTIGRQYWALKFALQCVYYVMVLTSVFMQIYRYDNESIMKDISRATVAISCHFIVQEMLQMAKEKSRYFQSVYNYVDLFAFVTPFVSSVLQLNWSDPSAQNPLLSFSLFELRVIQSICKFVSIIIRAVDSIRVFFFVFVGGIIAFAIAIMHLMRNCTNATVCPSYTEGFSLNIFQAISMTYFMMSGRYDPLSNGFSSNDVAFHIMLMFFFFFTVILMLNVLIALINHAFDDGDRAWELEWLQNRMRYVESTENLSYDIIETIYYTATPTQVREYRKKVQKIKEESSPTIEVTADAGATSQMLVSDAFDDSGQDRQLEQLRQAQMEENSTDAGDSRVLMAMLMQFRDEQKRAREEQQLAREEQQQARTERWLAQEKQ
ncbi:hypothetical protein BGW39_010013 [Mortierella sp. 14UC]|nr:hypothetical protein BGW39_010013 [Mortierella sp. 14UC]